MLKAVLLDRDGVLNEEVDLLHRPDQVRLIEGSAEAVASLNAVGILVLVVTNQPVVARNLCSEAMLLTIHQYLGQLLWEAAGARLDQIYYCPHHPHAVLADANVAYCRPCRCRKPETGLLEQALTEWRLHPQDCVLVGDSTRDILAGQRMGLSTILVQTGYGGGDGLYNVVPDRCFSDLNRVVAHLLTGLHASRDGSSIFPVHSSRCDRADRSSGSDSAPFARGRIVPFRQDGLE